MKREYLLMLVVVLLGFTGGVTTQQWLSADGSLGAPAYSFASETDLGLYRKAATQLCLQNSNDTDSLVCVDDGRLLVSGTSGAPGTVRFDNTSGSISRPFFYIDDTLDYMGSCAESANGDYFIGTYAGDASLAYGCQSMSTTYLTRLTYNASTANLSALVGAGTAWTSSNYLGASVYSVGTTLDVGAYLFTDGATATTSADYITQAATDELSYYHDGALIGYSRNKDIFEFADAKYPDLPTRNSTTLDTECNESAETGRLVVDYGDDRLYVCNYDGGNTWMYVDLVE